MRVAVTGASGFVGRHLCRYLTLQGHTVAPISRFDTQTVHPPACLHEVESLLPHLSGCDAVIHCAGINREVGANTYQRVHLEGTRAILSAAKEMGVGKFVHLGYLRARPESGCAYLESKFEAETMVRQSSMDYTIFKPGMIFGYGDHMLRRTAFAVRHLPVFGLVGLKKRYYRPVSIEDVIRLLNVSLTDPRLSDKTFPLMGPESITLSELVHRVAAVECKTPVCIPLPVPALMSMAWLMEKLLPSPLVTLSQVRMLSEGMTEGTPPFDTLPEDLEPFHRLTAAAIRQGLEEVPHVPEG